MTTESRQEAGRGLEERILLRRRLSRRALLTLPLSRGGVAAQGEAVPGRQVSRPIRCGACGGYHVLNVGCPVEARQQDLARAFHAGHEAAASHLKSETKEEERGS